LKAGTDPQKLQSLAQAFEKIAAMSDYKVFLKQQRATDDSFVSAKNAPAFLQEQLANMKQIVQSLPFHAQYLWEGQTVEAYVEPF